MIDVLYHQDNLPDLTRVCKYSVRYTIILVKFPMGCKVVFPATIESFATFINKTRELLHVR